MSTPKIIKYQLQDVFRSKWIWAYALFFFAITEALFRFGGDGDRVITSMMNVVLLVIPLISIVLGAMYLYNSREYIELLLCQPVKRSSLFMGLFSGVTLPLSTAFAVGVAVPFLMRGSEIASTLFLLITGILLTVIFVAMAFGLALSFEDRIKGLGIALVLWLFFTVIYDGIILLIIYGFSDYPLQQPVIVLSMLNPVDLGRILLLLNYDISALMGFTGAVFQRFFGSLAGQSISLTAMGLWLAIPFWLGRRAFLKRNF